MTNLFLAIAATAILSIAIVLFRKSKKSPNLEKRDSSTYDITSTTSQTNKPQAYRATLSLDEKDHSVRPEGNQQRNLDREVGGLEEGKKRLKENDKDIVEQHIEDVWDKRSEEVDEIGSINPVVGDDKESMLWGLKKIRLKIGKHLVDDHGGKDVGDSGKNFDSRYAQGGFSQLIKARQDFDRENDGGGGMSR